MKRIAHIEIMAIMKPLKIQFSMEYWLVIRQCNKIRKKNEISWAHYTDIEKVAVHRIEIRSLFLFVGWVKMESTNKIIGNSRGKKCSYLSPYQSKCPFRMVNCNDRSTSYFIWATSINYIGNRIMNCTDCHDEFQWVISRRMVDRNAFYRF